MYALLIKLLLAHLIGDFVLQTRGMVIDINTKKLKSIALYAHALVHGLLLLCFTTFQKEFVLPTLCLVLSHLIIDMVTKTVLKQKLNPFVNFLLDQGLHFICILIFIHYFYPYPFTLAAIFTPQVNLLIIALLSLTVVAAIFIKKVMEVFDYPIPNDGLRDAGKYIGMMERLLIFFFVISSFWEGIGFLLAAKSIFRFGDLKENKEIKLTEYILIGTLLSFGLAIVIALLYLKFKILLS
jgi:hypothetical protein